MSKLADILFKPIGIVVSADKVQIVRPNGDKISCTKECYFFLGDKIVNNSDEDVEVTINGEKVKLEPKESTTVVSIDQKTIDNIALLQKELIKGKSIDELEDTTAGKNLLDSVGAISDIVFIKSGHYSNVHASANDIDFIQNIKELEMAGPKQPNISEKSNYLYTPVTDKPSNIIPIENQVGGGGAPNNGGNQGETPSPSNPQITPPNIPQFNTGGMKITFLEDANKNGTLSIAENLAPKSTTTVRVWLPEDAEEDKTLFFYKSDRNSKTNEYLEDNYFHKDITLTSGDIDNGYVDFEVPVNNIKENYINAHADYVEFDYYSFEMNRIYTAENKLKVEVDQNNIANFINLIVQPINGNNLIDDNSLPNEKLDVNVRIENGGILNSGYEVELKINGKTYKTFESSSDHTYTAKVRLADLKDDADQKVEAFLKKASYNIENNDGTATKIDMADKTTLGDEYTTNFTKSYITFSTIKLNLADIRNQNDVDIKGEIRGIYNKTGDVVFIELPGNQTRSVSVQRDGTFELKIKPAEVGFGANYTPNYAGGEQGKDFYIKAKYNNDTGHYNDVHRLSANFQRNLFGLTPTIRKADDNDVDITFKEVKGFKNSLNIKETDKIYSTEKGTKFSLDLDFSPFLVDDKDRGIRGFTYDHGTFKYVQKIPDDINKQFTETMDGWHYEVFLQKGQMTRDEYNYMYFHNRHHSDPTKIFDGIIKTGVTHYTHDFDLRDFYPTKPEENEVYYFFTKIIPPSGAPIVKAFYSKEITNETYIFDSEIIKQNNSSRYGEDYFSTTINTFYKGEEITLDNNLGHFNEVRNGDADTLYYTDSVSKINISGNLFNPDRIEYVPQNDFSSLSKMVPDSAYLVINGKKYQGEISSDGGVIFKDILTKDFKDDPDHKYEIFTVFNAEDKFGNNKAGKGQYSYNIVDETPKTQSEINAAFTFDSSNIAIEDFDDLPFDPLKRGDSHFDEPNNTDKPYIGVAKIDNNVAAASSVIYTVMKNKYATHFDHDTVFKIDVNIPGDMNGGLFWYDPSIKSIRKITNGEIHVKAGTNFKDIVIMQAIKNDHKSDYDSEDSTTNEFGRDLTPYIGKSNMALKTKTITTTIKDVNDNIIATNISKVADDDYDIEFHNFGSNIYLFNFFKNEFSAHDRNIIFKNATNLTYSINNAEALDYANVTFDIPNSEASLFSSSGNSVALKKVKLSANNISLDMASNSGTFIIEDLSTNLTDTQLANGMEYDVKIKRSGGVAPNINVLNKENETSYDFKGIHFLNGADTTSSYRTPLIFSIRTDTFAFEEVVNGETEWRRALKAKTIKNLKTSDDIEFALYMSNFADGGEGTIFENLEIVPDNSGYIPTISFPTMENYYFKQQLIHIKNSIIKGNIANSPDLIIENSTIGDTGITTNIEVAGSLTLTTGITFNGKVEVNSADTNYGGRSNSYLFDITVDNDFTLTDLDRDTNVYYDKRYGEIEDNVFTFGSHAKIGSHATFNVDHSTMTFENGSVFEGTIKSGTNTNNFVIKAGATFNGTIEMADAINNITIEDGAILGPNFHITETNTESEAVNGKYDTLTLFNDIDFTNLDVKGLDQINIGTKARGEMIDMDIVFDELNSLLGGGKNTIKFWGDNDNHLTFHNEANRTFSVAADQSAVASQPYTRYEASDTASGTKYYIDVHNDINLQIL